MKKKQPQPSTNAQKVFGKMFDNMKIINERPEGMPFEQYKKERREQTQLIKMILR